MYIDSKLTLLPTVTVGRRFIAFLLDLLLTFFIPALVGVVCLPLYVLVLVGVPSEWVTSILNVIITITMLYVLIWGRWLRVGQNGQTLGMSLMKIAIASDKSTFKSNFINKLFFWVHYSHKNVDAPWAGDEIEERTDAQLWRGLVPRLVFPVIALFTLLAVQTLGRAPFVIGSLIQGEFSLAASNDYVSTGLLFLVLVFFIVIECGFLLALGRDRRTLVDHFLGIKLVDVTGTEFDQRISGLEGILGWLKGNPPQTKDLEK